MHIIDADALIEEIQGYDLDENSREYMAFMKEIKNAPIVARTWKEWWQMRMRVQGRSIDYRFKDRPILKEEYKSRLEFYAGLVVFFATISILSIIYVIGQWFV